MRIDTYNNAYRKYVNFIKKYRGSSNAATASEVDSNANVESKNIATCDGELCKREKIGTNRLLMIDKITELYGEELAEEYIRQLEEHEIYKHDETSIYPYCVSITMYPFLFDGLKSIGGKSGAPTNLDSYCGAFINLVFAVAAQFAGAVSTPEFLMYMDYFIRKDYGDDYVSNWNTTVTTEFVKRQRTLKDIVYDKFQQVVYSINQPAAARGFQSIFWNDAYFDEPYFKGMFENFVFPDGSKPNWETVSFLQWEFMNWFNRERLKAELTFPVETMNLLNDGKKFVDEEWFQKTAMLYEAGHSFFTYTSDSVDSLASCCRLRNEMQDNTFSYTLGAGGVSTGSKGVMTININRLVQNATRDGVDISTAIAEQVEKIHKYLTAFNEIIKDNFNARLLTVYDAGFISLDKQYLTVGINGFVEGAEFLGIEVSAHNPKYVEYCEKILKPIYDLNKRDRTSELMFNTEFVPKMCGHKVA